MNLHIKSRKIYFVRAGLSPDEDSYKADTPLSPAGVEYSKHLAKALLDRREVEKQNFISQGGSESEFKKLAIWSSNRRRTSQTAAVFREYKFAVREKTQLGQLNPGDAEKHTDEELRTLWPEDWEQHQLDPYHHRYPRGESYHDLAVRMEPVILELEREKNDVLVVAHESVLRVLYGYLMACSTQDIPSLMFARNEIVEVRSYSEIYSA
jgi:6-phosphofructo-2-kinase/fructose-2,6-biphosphatase 4